KSGHSGEVLEPSASYHEYKSPSSANKVLPCWLTDMFKSLLFLLWFSLALTYGYVSRLPDSDDPQDFWNDSDDSFLEPITISDDFLPPKQEEFCGEEKIEVGPVCPVLAERFPHFNSCCQHHVMCYSSCSSRTSKAECDLEFGQCLQKECMRNLVAPDIHEQRRCITSWAWNGDDMREFGVSRASDFNCNAFDSFRRKCDFFFDVPVR
ncbi:hypothetical protein K493DRAFT_384386, partial [Basidiobolus meristosporus CBS 931.73]